MFRVFIKQNRRTWRYRVASLDVDAVRNTVPSFFQGQKDTVVLISRIT